MAGDAIQPKVDAVQQKLKDLIQRGRDLYASRQSIAGAWDTYGRAHRLHSLLGDQHKLGDEWSRPDWAGLDITPEEFVPYLDEKVFSDFLGSVDTILEIGPGGGRFTEILLPKCKRLIAAETAKSMLQLLRERFANETVPTIEYLHLDGKGFKTVPDNSVDAVFSYGVFVHLEHWDFYNYLTETARVLRPGGRAIIQHANTFSYHGWEQFTTKDLPVQLGQHKLWFSFNVMTPELMASFVEKAGLKLVDCLTTVVNGAAISLIELPA